MTMGLGISLGKFLVFTGTGAEFYSQVGRLTLVELLNRPFDMVL